jgi:hypothetical protein
MDRLVLSDIPVRFVPASAIRASSSSEGRARWRSLVRRVSPSAEKTSSAPEGRYCNPAVARTNTGKNDRRTATSTTVQRLNRTMLATTGMITTIGTVGMTRTASRISAHRRR